MSLLKQYLSKYFPVLNSIFILIWLNNLAHTDAYFSVYVLVSFVAFYLTFSGKEITDNNDGILTFVLSSAFSLLIILGNYPLFTLERDPARIGSSTNLMVNLINTGLSFIGGITVSYPILSRIFHSKPYTEERSFLFKQHKLLPVLVFFLIAGINLIHLFFVEYPANITEDTITQIGEMLSGNYSNFNTFWHTIMLKFVLTIGYSLFGSVNSATVLFSVCQILVMAFSFTYSLVTIHEIGVSRKLTVIFFCLFLLMPYHMALTISIWKDVLFAGGCLMMTCALFRIMKGLGNHSVLDIFLFIFGSLLFILARTNGWIIYFVLFLCYLVFCRRNRILLAVMGALSVLGWFMLNPMLGFLNVSGGDPVESLSIPIQQVSRVIVEGHELSQEDTDLLSKVIDIEEVPDLYVEWLSDPMKIEVRSKDYEYFLSNFSEYRDLWVRLGVQYPWEYVKAWVDQTKGYWNGGYGYAMYSETVVDNPYGLEKIAGNNPIASLFRLYFGLSRHVVFFEPFHSIGLHVWIMILSFLLNVKRRREEWIISVPVLVLVIGLWFGTPVYACFRYVYPLFVCLPLIVSTALYSKE